MIRVEGGDLRLKLSKMTDFWRAKLPGLVPQERISFFEPSGTPAHYGSETSRPL